MPYPLYCADTAKRAETEMSMLYNTLRLNGRRWTGNVRKHYHTYKVQSSCTEIDLWQCWLVPSYVRV